MARRAGGRPVGRGRCVQPESGGEQVVYRDQPALRGILYRARQIARLTAAADSRAADATRGGGLPLGQHRTLAHAPILAVPVPSARPPLLARLSQPRDGAPFMP